MTILIIVILLIVAIGITYYASTGENPLLLFLPSDDDADADADADGSEGEAGPSAGPSPGPTESFTPTVHTLSGDKFLIAKKSLEGVIVPVVEDNKFEINTSGVRTSAMVITLEPVESEDETYLLHSKSLDKYIKYHNGGFSFSEEKPTTNIYKVKFTKIGDDYAMSYKTTDGVEMFFGYNDEENKMVSDDLVTAVTETGLVNFEEVETFGFIVSGNFGDDASKFTAYGDDTVTGIVDCKTKFDDLEDDVKTGTLSIAYKPMEEEDDKPCRAYSEGTHDVEAADWLTMCRDPKKNIEQGCLLEL